MEYAARKWTPFYCCSCGAVFGTADPPDRCWKCRRTEFTEFISLLRWSVALGTHSGDKRFHRLQNISAV
jgi:hypothetical protein